MLDIINNKIEELKSKVSRHDFIFSGDYYKKDFEPLFVEELKKIQKYIKNNYNLDFETSTYGYSPAIQFIDKKRKAQYNLHLTLNYDYELCLGEEFQKIPYTYSSGGAVKYNGFETVDSILQNTFKYKKEITIFDFIEEE